MADFKKLNFPKEIKEVIIAPIPAELIKEREGGGKKMLSYISGSTVTDMLNHAFGYMWNWEAEKEWVQESIPAWNKYKKNEKGIVEPGFEKQGPVAHVKGRLTVYLDKGNGEVIAISKTGYGSKSILGKQNDQESIFKAAGTDALKKAASLFGIGLELYRDEEETEYFNNINYEDPWTEEFKEQYKKEREYINSLIEEYNMEVSDLDDMVSQFSEGELESLEDIVPENITSFVEYLKQMIAEAAKTQE